jgi:hypothetical protein
VICPISRPDETGAADVDRVAEPSVETCGGWSRARRVRPGGTADDKRAAGVAVEAADAAPPTIAPGARLA